MNTAHASDCRCWQCIARENGATTKDPAPTISELPELPESVGNGWMDCEDCEGHGIAGEPRYLGTHQPPEYEDCGSCNGSGRWRATFYTADQMRAYVLADRASPRSTKGWVSVPKKPTAAMQEAGARSIIDGQEGRPGTSWADEACIAYRAMLAAAPTGAAEEKGQES